MTHPIDGAIGFILTLIAAGMVLGGVPPFIAIFVTLAGLAIMVTSPIQQTLQNQC